MSKLIKRRFECDVCLAKGEVRVRIPDVVEDDVYLSNCPICSSPVDDSRLDYDEEDL